MILPSAIRVSSAILTLGTLLSAAASHSGESFKDCDVCPEMLIVPAGTFIMGSPETEQGRGRDESPRRTVTIAMPVAIGKYEVTWDEWDACVAEKGCDGASPESSGGDHGWGRGRNPAIEVNWHDAIAYATWLSRKTGKPYRLLSEAEWEYAARAGTTGRWSFDGDESQLCTFANHADKSTPLPWKNAMCSDGVGEGTAAVGSYDPNPWGLHDMHGNVWEWVADCYNDSYTDAPFDGSARTSDNCEFRVFRGGSWYFNPRNLRSADRNKGVPTDGGSSLGFRVARDLD